MADNLARQAKDILIHFPQSKQSFATVTSQDLSYLAILFCFHAFSFSIEKLHLNHLLLSKFRRLGSKRFHHVIVVYLHIVVEQHVYCFISKYF